ncbi:type IX secretion system plug protein [Tenacibaculum xiamenense]|uniref:type IX secretion system plug protein n=1 Tax=Tenacibaculum xiamenense TaxID=1261553 RepID=UPI003892D1F6
MNKIILYFLCFGFTTFLNAQNVKSILLRPANNPKQYNSIVKLGNVLELSFDDLDADNKDYYYKIEHMTHDWKPSNLTSSQYIDGFDQNSIIDVTNSFNSLQAYTHYSVRLPNVNTVITKSGNYLISVLNDDYETVFTRRCVFYEDKSIVGVATLRSRSTNTSQTDQTVQFRVSHPGIILNNPNQEIKAALIQNNDWNSVINDIPPLFIQPNLLVYNHINYTNFPGNNEFYFFDTKYVRNTSLNIANVVRDNIYHTYLFTDEPKANRSYTFNPDINGQFVINSLDPNTSDSRTEADYSMIHFSLKLDTPIKNKEVYVYGAFNDFELSDENKMTYNEEAGAYETSILLKQGFYNYTYAVVDNENNIDLKTIGGSFFETENEYTALIYYRPIGGFYDRVIGVGYGFFNQNR